MSEESSKMSTVPSHTHTTCPRCDKTLRVRYESLGNWLACKHCGHKFVSRVAVPCPGCRRPLHMQPQFYGRRVSCNSCQHSFRVRIPVACPHCAGTMAVGPRHLGEEIACTHCRRTFPFGPPPEAPAHLKPFQAAALLADLFAQRGASGSSTEGAASGFPKAISGEEKGDEVEQLRTALDAANRRREETDRHWEGLASYSASLEERIAELSRQLAAAESRWEESDEGRSDERGRWEGRLAAARLDHERQAAVIQEEADRQRKRAEGFREEMTFAQQSLQRLTAERDALLARVAEQESTAQDLGTAREDEADRLVAALESSRQQQDALTRRIEELTAESLSLQSDLATVRREATEQTARLQELEQQRAIEWQSWQERLTEAGSNYEAELRHIQGTQEAERQELVQQLETERSRAVAERQAWDQRLRSLQETHERQCAALRREVEQRATERSSANTSRDGAANDTFWAILGGATPPEEPSRTPQLEEMLRWAADNGAPPPEKIEEVLQAVGPQPVATLLRMGDAQEAPLRLGAARACRWLAEKYRRTNEMELADRACSGAIQVLGALAQEFPAVPALRAELGANRLSHARIQFQNGQVQQALSTFQAARETAESLVNDHPQQVSYRRALALCLHDLAVVLLKVGVQTDAQVYLRQAVAHQTEVIGSAPQVGQYRAELERMEQLLRGVPAA